MDRKQKSVQFERYPAITQVLIQVEHILSKINSLILLKVIDGNLNTENYHNNLPC